MKMLVLSIEFKNTSLISHSNGLWSEDKDKIGNNNDINFTNY